MEEIRRCEACKEILRRRKRDTDFNWRMRRYCNIYCQEAAKVARYKKRRELQHQFGPKNQGGNAC